MREKEKDLLSIQDSQMWENTYISSPGQQKSHVLVHQVLNKGDLILVPATQVVVRSNENRPKTEEYLRKMMIATLSLKKK